MNHQNQDGNHELELERLEPPAGWVIRRHSERRW